MEDLRNRLRNILSGAYDQGVLEEVLRVGGLESGLQFVDRGRGSSLVSIVICIHLRGFKRVTHPTNSQGL